MENGKKTDLLLNQPRIPRLRYTYRAICAVIITFVALMLYLTMWLLFLYKYNNTGYLLGWGNLSLATLLYVLLFSANGKFLKAFKIGVERKTKLLPSVALTILMTNVFEIFVSMAIINNFRYFFALTWRFAALSIAQVFVLSVVAIIMTDLYRVLVKPLPVVLIHGDFENNMEYKMNSTPQKYTVEMSVRYDDPDIDMDELIDKCSSILINDVPAHVENTIIKKCFEKNKRVYVVPKIADIILKASDHINVFDTPLYLSRNLGMSNGQKFMKRLMDIVFCGIAVVVFSPVFLITALAIKLEDGGPVFFKQERVTKNGKHFMILKFRSMIVDAEKDGRPHPAGEKDDRITKVGRVIRGCRIDELPQLFNILSGDMSIVGPRPERYEHVEMYTREIPEFRLREKVKGGLTGYAQVYGKYNTSALDKLKMDLMYITNYSIFLDLEIIFETVKIILLKESTEGFTPEKAKKLHDMENKST